MAKKMNKYFTLLSLVFGDGHIDCRRSIKGSLDIAHSSQHKDLIAFKKGILDKLNIDSRITIKKKSEWGNHNLIRLTTKSSKLIGDIRRNIYHVNGKKIFKKKWINHLDVSALAILWMDDGALCHQRKKKKDGSYYVYEYGEISTCAFDYSSVENIVLWLKKFDIDSRITKTKLEGQFTIRFNRENLKKMISLISDDVINVPSMIYKITI